MSIDANDLPEGVDSIYISEQKVFDGLTFPLILSPTNSYMEKDVEFWNEWIKKNLKIIENLLFKYGTILFRGFPLDTPKDFDAFANAYGYDPFHNVGHGGAERFNVLGNVYTASELAPPAELAFHHEMAHVNDYPHILFFYCEIPANERGNTPLALSNVVYRKMVELDPNLVRRLEREGLCYSRVAHDENVAMRTYTRSWQSTFFTDIREEAEKKAIAQGFNFEWLEDGSMKLTSKTYPAVRFDKRTGKNMWFNSLFAFLILSQNKNDPSKMRVSFPNGDSINDDSIEILRQVMEETKVSFKWKRTDVIMIDNRTTMHAKESYSSPPRSILVSFFKDYQGPLEVNQGWH